MKAAVVYGTGGAPQYEEMPDPVPQQGLVLVRMKAVAISNHERSTAAGAHYSSKSAERARIPGRMGIGFLEDGTRVAGVNPQGGMLAELALVRAAMTVAVPAALDDATAAALPNAVIGSSLAMLHRGGFRTGDTVLVQGGTGFTGSLAVQLARLYGAGRVVATGRNAAQLGRLRQLGADATLSLTGSDKEVSDRFRSLLTEGPVDVVLDYLWGHPAALLLRSFAGDGRFTRPLRYVVPGAMAGDEAAVSAEMLRSADIRILGSGHGSLSEEDIRNLFSKLLPQAFDWAAAGQLLAPTISVPLEEVETAFSRTVPAGHRLVVTM